MSADTARRLGLVAENERLKEGVAVAALRFYADNNNWHDGGTKARQALIELGVPLKRSES